MYGDALGVVIDALNGALDVAKGTGHVQTALFMATIDLHVDDDQVNVLLRLPRLALSLLLLLQPR